MRLDALRPAAQPPLAVAPSNKGAAKTEPVTLSGSAEPNAPIKDYETTSSTITLGEDATLDSLKLSLDVKHSWRGDLVVTLTAPSGKAVTVSNREGGYWDDLRGTFDFSQAFQGESAKGDWTLKVEDKAKRDEGVLEKWSLAATGQRELPQETVTPVAISTLLDKYGWQAGGWQDRLLHAADEHGKQDGAVTVKELDGYLADPDDLKFLTSSAMQTERNLITAAGGSRDVSAFEDGWQRNLAGKADGDADGKLTGAELNSYLTTVKSFGSASADAATLWMPEQKADPFDSRIADFTHEPDLLTPGGMPASAILLSKNYMRISSDSERRVPQWVSYSLSAADLLEKTKAERKDNFRPDPELGDKSASDRDYVRSGYDRGHHRPARDSVNQESMDESFLMSNIAPQLAELNQKSWELLEQGTWELTQATGGKATIFTGGLFLDSKGKPLPPDKSDWIGPQGQNRVGVPSHFFKAVLLTKPDGTQQMFAYLLPNRRGIPSADQAQMAKFLAASRVSVDRVEELLGQDLFPGLADDVEARLESDAAPVIDVPDRTKWKAASAIWPPPATS